jgi:DNA-binding GntR family transcriptional regulator
MDADDNPIESGMARAGGPPQRLDGSARDTPSVWWCRLPAPMSKRSTLTHRLHLPANRGRQRSSAGSRKGPMPASSLTDRVYRELREAIVSLKLAPGAAISEASVSRRFGGSRTPVRPALERLEREGLLAKSNSGVKRRLLVAPLSASDMRQLFQMVGALNGLAARLAAQLPDKPRRQLVDELRRINRDLDDVAHADHIDVRQVEELDSAFHRAYELVTDAPRLVLELESLGALRTRYIRVYTEALAHTRNLRDSVLEHTAILDALAAGDPERAEHCAVFNYRKALERFGRALQSSGERGTWF